jgi:hypothetical protein
MKLVIGVIGPALPEYQRNKKTSGRIEREAEEIGELLAKRGAIVMTGGMDGVMESVCKGARKVGGITIGTPGRARGVSNRFVDIEILTPIDVGDFLFTGSWTCGSIIAFPGGAGTMAELCLAYRLGKPIIIMKGMDPFYDSLVGKYFDNGKVVRFMGAGSPKEAVDKALKAARQDIKKAGKL